MGRVCTKIEGAYGRKAFLYNFCFGERGCILSKNCLETPNVFIPNDFFLPVGWLGMKNLLKSLACPHIVWINFTCAWYNAHRQDYQCSVQTSIRTILSTWRKLHSKAKWECWCIAEYSFFSHTFNSQDCAVFLGKLLLLLVPFPRWYASA